MNVKSNYTKEEWIRFSVGVTLHGVLLITAVLVFMNYYFTPVLNGYVLISEHLQEEYGEENYFIALSGLNEKEIQDQFIEKVNEVDWGSMSEEEGTAKMSDLIYNVSEEPLDSIWGIILYLHAPLLVSPLVLLFLIRIAMWCSSTTNRIMGLNIEKTLRVWREK